MKRRDERAGGMSRRAEAQTRLGLLLDINPTYAIQYQRTFDALRNAETATDRALARAAEKLEKAKEALNETLSRAARSMVQPSGAARASPFSPIAMGSRTPRSRAASNGRSERCFIDTRSEQVTSSACRAIAG